MDLTSYLKSLPDEAAREAFATLCKTSVGHLRNIGYGQKPCSTKIAVRIERYSGGVVRRWDVCPDDWWEHWPELIGTKGAPRIKLEKAA